LLRIESNDEELISRNIRGEREGSSVSQHAVQTSNSALTMTVDFELGDLETESFNLNQYAPSFLYASIFTLFFVFGSLISHKLKVRREAKRFTLPTPDLPSKSDHDSYGSFQ